MTSLNKILAGALTSAGILAFSAASASAAIVCTGDVCWHTHERYSYPPSAHVTIHEDNWRPRRSAGGIIAYFEFRQGYQPGHGSHLQWL